MKTDIKRIARDGVLTAVALTVFMIELQIPELVPIPGVKLGLANIVTLVAMFTLGPVDALVILVCRVLLGALFAGNLMALLYSLAGGILAYLVMLVWRRLVSREQIWVASVFAAMAHNLGQIAAAIAVTSTPSLIVYLPVLMVSGVISGILTGFAGQFTAVKLRDILRK